MENNLTDIQQRHTLTKGERLCSHKAIEALFGGGNRSLTAYPIRAIYSQSEEPETRILISVSKRHFKRAVKRNRVKRQIREAYRMNKQLITPQQGMNIAFLWLSDDLMPSTLVSEKVCNLLKRIQEHA